jgi:hypothetical protein
MNTTMRNTPSPIAVIAVAVVIGNENNKDLPHLKGR